MITERNAYEQKLERRRERLEARADRLDQVASAEFRKADLREEASGIPFGQPILVGHHSERKHRRAIERAHKAMGRGVAASNAADEARARAASVGTGGISSDDPEALTKLRAKKAELVKRADEEVRWNKQIRTGGVDAMDAPASIKESVRATLAHSPYLAKHGVFFVSNRRAEIRRLAKRIEQMEREAARPAAAPIEREDGVRVIENVDENRIQIIFPDKPSAEDRAILKGRGFRWSPSAGAWQRHLNNAGRHAAKAVLESLAAQ